MITSELIGQISDLKKKMRDPNIAMDDVLKEIEAGLELYPSSPDLICLKADLYYEMAAVRDMSSHEKPIDLYKRAVKIDESNFDAVAKTASYLSLVLEKYSESIPYYEKAIALGADEDIYSQYADALASIDRIDKAIDVVESSTLDSKAIARIVSEIKDEYL